MTCRLRAVRNRKIRTDDAFDGHSVEVFSKVGARMAARKSRRKQSRRAGTHRGEPKTFSSRYSNLVGVVGGLAGVAALIVALIALIPAFRSVTISQDANWLAQNANLSIVGLDVKATSELNEETKFSGKVVQTRKVNTSAAKIILRNSGSQAARITQLRVHISKVWVPEGCHGAGPGITSVLYDFVLPGDLTNSRLPLTMSKDIDFEVEGQSNDRLAVTIGEDYIGEAGWPWIVSASAELVLDDGKRLSTREFVLMDHNQVDHVVDLVQEGMQQGYSRADCVRRNMTLLEEALRAPGEHAPSMQRLLDRLKTTGIGSATGSSYTATAEPSATTGTRDSGMWVAQLGSYPEATSSSALEVAATGIEKKLGLEVQTARSGQYASLTPGYWVVFYENSFANGHEALSFCSQHGVTGEDACVGRYFSSEVSDRPLTCRFSDSPDSVACVRP
jgi:hypothetical protein